MAHRQVAKGLLELLEHEPFGEVESIRYRHLDDDEHYEHQFKPGAIMTALADGSLRIANPTSKVWDNL